MSDNDAPRRPAERPPWVTTDAEQPPEPKPRRHEPEEPLPATSKLLD